MRNKNKKILIFILISPSLITIIITIILLYNIFPKNKTKEVVFENQKTINAEIAETKEQHTKGLMFRKSLKGNSGMLFVFNSEKPRNFWMKNTLIPLDMIFLNSEKQIIQIIKNTEPCKQELCKTYSSKPAKYVIEVNAGFTEFNNITTGQKVYFDS
ncbi:hypothetical protein GF386_03455 [Candidatus Pacearchaeota archaeon]|nr:hypothetical protein [Candidatus Pacearchaeota archaeon]MBD3283198.1 hypothetical protein [Candidatus Pacearchaeota archaeon]